MADETPKAKAGGGRRTLVGALVTLGALVGILAIFAIWVSRQVLETDQWTETSSELLEEPVVQTAVAGFLVDRLYANVDVDEELRAALPARADPLAGTAAAALRRGAEDVAERALARPEVQQAWEDANRQAHLLLIRIVERGGDVVGTDQGVVTLDLKTLLDELAQRVGIGARVASRIPADAASIEVLRSDQLESSQNVADVLKPLALVLVLLMLGLFGAAIVLAHGRRRTTLRACGFGLIFAGVAALAIRALAGDAVVDSLASTAAAEPTVAAVWDIGTSFLVGVATATVAYGVFVVAGTWLSGPTRAAMTTRRWAAPYARDRRIAYGVLTVAILLVLAWGPTEGTRRLLPAITLIVLTVAGFEVLRRMIVAEFPDAVRAPAGTTMARARGALQRVRSPAPAPEAAPATSPSAPLPQTLIEQDVAMDQLQRLAELHRSGDLDDDEFAAAKHRVLART